MGRYGEGENTGPGTVSSLIVTIYLQLCDIDETCRGADVLFAQMCMA